MPFEPGNKLGGRKSSELSFREMLVRASVQEDAKRVRQAAEKLLTLAAEGESWAIKELADRLDGKPAQAVTGANGKPLEMIVRWMMDGEAKS